MICAGGGTGNFYLSKDRGNTWPYSWGIGSQPITDFFFLNKDTIFGLSLYGGLAKSTNGGSNWANTFLPIYSSYGINFKNANEGFVVGANLQNKGIIARTIDAGQTWQTFNTGITTTLLNIVLLNDSIALLSGTNGVLLKWNYKNTLFTGINDNYLDAIGLEVFQIPSMKNYVLSLKMF